MFLAATDAKTNPGGPFVSIHAELFPIVICLSVLFFLVRNFQAASTARRVGISILAMISLGTIALAVSAIVMFCRHINARGDLLGW